MLHNLCFISAKFHLLDNFIRLRIFKYSIQRNKSGLKSEEETMGWRKLQKEELQDLQC
jgi:hypothetical protein